MKRSLAIVADPAQECPYQRLGLAATNVSAQCIERAWKGAQQIRWKPKELQRIRGAYLMLAHPEHREIHAHVQNGLAEHGLASPVDLDSRPQHHGVLRRILSWLLL